MCKMRAMTISGTPWREKHARCVYKENPSISKASLAGIAKISDNRSLGHCHLGLHQDTGSLTPAVPPNDNFKAPADATGQPLMQGSVAHYRPYDTSIPPVCVLSRLERSHGSC